MLESLISIDRIIKKPYLALVWAFLLGSIAILVSLQVSFDILIANNTVNLAGIFSVLFAIIPASYFITQIIRREEIIVEVDIKRHHLYHTWRRHGTYILLLLFFFTGMTLSFAVWSFAFSDDTFQIQDFKIAQIRSGITGSATAHYQQFQTIFSNNMQVMLISFLFSFIFGAGAIFIVVWNASVLGVFIGQTSRSLLEILPVSVAFIPHGVPEIGGYVMAGLAGGILSAAIIRGSGGHILRTIAFDSLKLLLLASVLIILGAGAEVYL